MHEDDAGAGGADSEAAGGAGAVPPGGGGDAVPGGGDDAVPGGGSEIVPGGDAGLLARMRAAPVLAGPLPHFDPAAAPGAPGPLFARWLDQALADGVAEPHVMTLSTVAADGTPSARVLMLRGVDSADCSVLFASDAGSRKGRDLAERPVAALTWYWPAHGRQIRMAGPVSLADERATRQDFLGRSPASRAAGFTGRMSEPLADAGQYARARAEAEALVAAEPERVPDGHRLYRLRAHEAEFFQAGAQGRHVRVRYTREGAAEGSLGDGGGGGDAAGSGWHRTLLWP